MNKDKSIDELLSSIVSLVNEAKNEYKFVISKDVPKNIYPEIEKIEKENSIEVKKKSNTVAQAEINSFDEKKLKRFNNWENINFEKSIKNSFFKNFSSNPSYHNNEKIEVEFRSLLNLWLKKNLNKLIELEISNYIKNRQH